MMTEDRYLTPKEASKFLGVSEYSLKILRLKGNGPAYSQFNRRTLRYRKIDLIEWMEEKKFFHTSQYASRAV